MYVERRRHLEKHRWLIPRKCDIAAFQVIFHYIDLLQEIVWVPHGGLPVLFVFLLEVSSVLSVQQAPLDQYQICDVIGLMQNGLLEDHSFLTLDGT